MKKIYLILFIALFGFSYPHKVWSQIFQQDFSTSNSIYAYYNASAGVNQFTKIDSTGPGCRIKIEEGRLKFTRSTNNGGFIRNINFPSYPKAMLFQFKLKVANTGGSSTSAAIIQIGSNFNGGITLQANATVHSRLGITLSYLEGRFSLRDVNAAKDSPFHGGEKLLKWYINNSGAKLFYTNPNGGLDSVNNDKSDVWLDNELQFNELTCVTDSIELNNFRCEFRSGSADMFFDEFKIYDLNPPMPIKLLSFEANEQQDQIEIKWNTPLESDEDFFELQRSKNGMDFFTLAIIPKAKNENTFREYTYNDYEKNEFGTYYRLKSIDKNGDLWFSEAIYLKPEKLSNEINLSILNLTEQELNLELCDNNRSDFIVSAFGIMGERLYEKEFQSTSTCTVFKIPKPFNEKKIYILQLKTPYRSLVKKIYF